jgi:hypothetical protein
MTANCAFAQCPLFAHSRRPIQVTEGRGRRKNLRASKVPARGLFHVGGRGFRGEESRVAAG